MRGLATRFGSTSATLALVLVIAGTEWSAAQSNQPSFIDPRRLPGASQPAAGGSDGERANAEEDARRRASEAERQRKEQDAQRGREAAAQQLKEQEDAAARAAAAAAEQRRAEQARQEAEEQARAAAAAEQQRAEQARREAEEQARAAAAAEQQQRAEQARRVAEEQARAAAAAEQQRRAEQARRAAEEQARAAAAAQAKHAQEVAEAKAQAEADAKRRADEEAHRFSSAKEPAAKALTGAHSAEDGARYLTRGTAMIAQGDIIGARLFFERAAEAGLAQGALALGDTYNSATLRQLGVVGVAPDKAAARKWYQTALDLGSSEAKQRMETLDGR